MKFVHNTALLVVIAVAAACSPDTAETEEAPADEEPAAAAAAPELANRADTRPPLLLAAAGEPEEAEQPEPAAGMARSYRQEELGYVPPAERSEVTSEFSVKFGDNVSPYDVIGVFLMPGESIEFETVFERADATFSVAYTDGEMEALGDNRWRWTAPQEPGLYPIRIESDATDAEVYLNAFTKVPADEIRDGKLGEFRVGTYPDKDEHGQKALYEQPDGFIEVTSETMDAHISPNFQLKQFVSKQPSDIPKYVFLHERLLLKLERLINEYNDGGIEVDTFHIMSGYRTPFYNKAIGNVEFSRHVFGDAADIFVDDDGNGRMDDLNGDGESNLADAQLMADRIEDLFDEPSYQPFIGGLGIYGPAPHRGPFIHVDTRGYKARWTAP